MNMYPICELTGDPTLSKDSFTRIKCGMLYVKPKLGYQELGIMITH